MQHKAATVHQAKAADSDQIATAIASVLAPVILLGILLLAARVIWVRIKYLWEYGEVPRIYLRGSADRRRRKG